MGMAQNCKLVAFFMLFATHGVGAYRAQTAIGVQKNGIVFGTSDEMGSTRAGLDQKDSKEENIRAEDNTSYGTHDHAGATKNDHSQASRSNEEHAEADRQNTSFVFKSVDSRDHAEDDAAKAAIDRTGSHEANRSEAQLANTKIFSAEGCCCPGSGSCTDINGATMEKLCNMGNEGSEMWSTLSAGIEREKCIVCSAESLRDDVCSRSSPSQKLDTVDLSGQFDYIEFIDKNYCDPVFSCPGKVWGENSELKAKAKSLCQKTWAIKTSSFDDSWKKQPALQAKLTEYADFVDKLLCNPRFKCEGITGERPEWREKSKALCRRTWDMPRW